MAVDESRSGDFETLDSSTQSGPGPVRCASQISQDYAVFHRMRPLTLCDMCAAVEGWIVIVTNIHEEAQEDDVHEACADFGEVKNLHLNLDRRTGFVKGYALIEYANKSEAQEAINKLDGAKMLTNTVSAGWAFMRGPKASTRE